nr:hypothetical protein [Tanacetum cinerariifolium]
MTTLADKAILSGADNCSPMLEKELYDYWKSIMKLYMMNRQHGRVILKSVKHGPHIWPTIEEIRVTTPRKYNELTPAEALQADCDETECKLYDEFDKFAYMKGTTLRDFYLRFSLLLNDLNIYNVKLEQFQVNTKFLNSLHPEWSKFVTDVKIVWDLHTTNIDQLHDYLEQHEFHANEKTQVVNCTKINLENESVNDTLTAELERYKERVKVLKEGQIVKTTKVKVPKELPKVSIVNTSFKKLKHHLASFDVVVKERTTAIAIIEGDNSVSNQSALSFDHYFELNILKAQSQKKDMVISKLKERIKSLSGTKNTDKEKDFVITALKNDLRKLKGKTIVDDAVTSHTITPEMLKVDVEPLALKLLNNRTAHSDYLRHTQEQVAILREIVKQEKS